ncbi:conserved hypothetical protein [Leishmania infantum JPCM5]|uniref:Uncharacterized protein n=2 Tax=Leishmania infantum TaxID=5671 RepID=A4I8C1_LEIIN|nr:conserved hypothetical protein [Leishmania infantum JPCM5]CAC9527281.1 hypothetical_protein [Leishmania infantum]CAM71063.1 conserved hypothetical protein [Leishmania infantum JPCM5]SUZ44886.1 hypothetical_protein [Leishmania infantum]|eukprot:XP_001467990.1 conserved hypothetical protein [Leishmania infantum JPCM5]
MNLFGTLAVTLCAIFVLIILPDEDSVEPVHDLLLNYQKEALKSRYGDARSLNRSETRRIYNSVLSEVQKAIFNLHEDADRKAYTCSRIRSQARQYARSRDGTYKGPLLEIALQLRDGYVHGVKYLHVALQKDLSYSLALQRPTLLHTAMVVRQTYYCLAPTLSGGECPSYAFLRVIRDKSDTEILESCVRSNKGFNGV